MSDIVENPEGYFRDLVPSRDQLLRDLELEAAQEEIPIIGPLVGDLLYLLVAVTRAERILELGTATGYSAIHMARALKTPEARVITLENDPSMTARATKNFQKAGLLPWIEIITGDAQAQLPQMTDSFDFAFLDIEKEFYADVLPDLHRLLKPGGLLVADNVAFKDAHPFNQAISSSDKWRSVSLFTFLPEHSPEYDAITLALRL